MFDRYVVAETKPDWKRRALIIGSLALHIGGGIGLIIYSIMHVEEIVPAATPITIETAPPAPPAAKLGTRRKQEPPKTPPKPDAPKPDLVLRDPNPKAPDKPEKPTPEPDNNLPIGDPDGKKDGQDNGKGKGGGNDPNATGTGGGDDKGKGPPAPVEKMQAQFSLGKPISHPDPHLPDWYTNQHAQQKVEGRYKVCLQKDGHVAYVSTMTGLAGLDNDISAHIKNNWVYQPHNKDFTPCFVAIIKFEIK